MRRLIEFIESALFGQENLLLIKLTPDFDGFIEEFDEVILFFFLINQVESLHFFNSKELFDFLFFPSVFEFFLSCLVIQVDFG